MPRTRETAPIATIGTELVRAGAAALGTWRVAHLLAAEDGPGHVVARVRRRLGDSALGGLMDCFGCVSVWVAVPFALWARTRRTGYVAGHLAICGAAFLLERATDRTTPPVVFTDDPEGATP